MQGKTSSFVMSVVQSEGCNPPITKMSTIASSEGGKGKWKVTDT